MARTAKCIYCDIAVVADKGEGDHILPVQLGEFRNDVRFRRICRSCNNKIGRSEQQLLRCGPESFLRDVVKPKVPARRQRGRSHAKAAVGAPGPESAIDHGDHHELVVRSKDNPKDALPVDQIVIHDNEDREYFIRLFPGMHPGQLADRVKERGIGKIDKIWFHCDDKRCPEYQRLLKDVWPGSKIRWLPATDPGVTQVPGKTTFTVTDHYFRSLAKIGFHYYLAHSLRRFRGDEDCFAPIRDFIMNGGDSKRVFNDSGITLCMPFGELPSGGVKTPVQWCHWIAADETWKVAVVYVHLFVGPGCIPQSHYITLATTNSQLILPNATWGHIYLYDDPPRTGRYAGRVEEVEITRTRHC